MRVSVYAGKHANSPPALIKSRTMEYHHVSGTPHVPYQLGITKFTVHKNMPMNLLCIGEGWGGKGGMHCRKSF